MIRLESATHRSRKLDGLIQRPGQSEPPTTVWDGSEEEEGQLSAADKIALVAGVAVAAALLAGIATFLLF